MPAKPIGNHVITPHADDEMQRREISREVVEAILAAPEQRLPVRAGRDVLQSRINKAAPEKTYLVRVFVDIDRDPAEVVTVYKTSKIAKYWEADS